MAINLYDRHSPKQTWASLTIDLIDLTDTQFQIRTSLNQDKVEEYVQILRDSGRTDLGAFRTRPIVWKRRDGRYAILDGWHRIHAAQALSITQFDVNILQEDKTQAVIQAMRSNLSHGLPLKPQERVQACLRTFEALTTSD